MKVRKYKNGVIKLTATNKKDSLNLLKFMVSVAGDDDPEMKKLIEDKENECNKI